MIKSLIISITLILISSLSSGQSYIGFSGGILQPMAYESVTNDDNRSQRISTSNFNEKTSYYFSAHIKERLDKRYNFGLSFSLSYLDLEYTENISHKFGGNSSDINLTSYRLYLQLDLELAIIKKYFFFNFGPKIEIPINSYNYKKTSSNSLTSGYSEWFTEGKHKAGFGPGIFAGLTIEKNISKNKIVFLRSQVSYSIIRPYRNFKTYDFILALGIQFYLPNFIIGQKNDKTTVGQPFILNQKK